MSTSSKPFALAIATILFTTPAIGQNKPDPICPIPIPIFEQSNCSPEDPDCLDLKMVAEAVCAGVAAAMGGSMMIDQPESYIACYKTEAWNGNTHGGGLPVMVCRIEQGFWDDIPLE